MTSTFDKSSSVARNGNGASNGSGNGAGNGNGNGNGYTPSFPSGNGVPEADAYVPPSFDQPVILRQSRLGQGDRNCDYGGHCGLCYLGVYCQG